MGVGSGIQLRSFCLYHFSKEAWNPHSAMEYGIYWFTGTREFHSVLLSPVLRWNPPPPLSKTHIRASTSVGLFSVSLSSRWLTRRRIRLADELVWSTHQEHIKDTGNLTELVRGIPHALVFVPPKPH